MAKTLYTLEVFLYDAPASEEFAAANPEVGRTIEIRGDQTLGNLHDAIFKAFDRWEDHMYEFHFGDGPHDYSRGRYGPSLPFEMPGLSDDDEPAGDAAKTRLDSLGLAADRSFGYWFDFGDDWYHQITVTAIGEAEPKVRYPRVTERVGESPPQYLDEEEEGDDDEE
jgi:hypothetical protein